jgi:hypothetical protein
MMGWAPVCVHVVQCKKKGKVLGWDRQNLKDFKRYYTHIYALSCWAVKHHIHDSRAPWVGGCFHTPVTLCHALEGRWRR